MDNFHYVINNTVHNRGNTHEITVVNLSRLKHNTQTRSEMNAALHCYKFKGHKCNIPSPTACKYWMILTDNKVINFLWHQTLALTNFDKHHYIRYQ